MIAGEELAAKPACVLSGLLQEQERHGGDNLRKRFGAQRPDKWIRQSREAD